MMRGSGGYCSHEYPPEFLQVESHYDGLNKVLRIAYCSQLFRIYWQHLELRESWCRLCDPIALCRFIEQMIGEGLRYCDRYPAGAEMAQSMLPNWNRAIQVKMEEMEHWERSRRMAPMRAPSPSRADMTMEEFARYQFAQIGRDEYRHSQMMRNYWATALTETIALSPKICPKAQKKAEELLLKNLSEEQAAQYRKEKKFVVIAKNNLSYEISHARSFNVRLIADNKKYCGQLSDAPIEDQMLAQKLLLEHDPDKFFKNANVSGGGASEYNVTIAGSGETGLEFRSTHFENNSAPGFFT